jgi:hypothetical protein
MVATLQLGEWLPDLPALNNPGVTVAKNVVAAGSSYGPFLSQVIYSNALGARCQGAFSTKDSDGNSGNFAADISKLYRMTNATFANVSKVGGYTTGTDEMWYWTRFNNLLLATNFTDAIQSFDVDSGTVFADLAAGAPKARYIATIGNFVVVGNTFDGVDGNVPNRIRWPAIGDPTDWVVSAATLSDYEDLDVSKGWVRQIVGGEFGTIFQEKAISRMEFIGSPGVFQFREVESGRGTMAPGSVVKVGNVIFYLGLDGFYIFDGNQSVPIGVNKIDKTFFADVDLSYLTRISGTADVDKQVVYWAYAGAGNTSGRSNRIISYNYSPNAAVRWAIVENVDIEFIYNSISEGYTLDSLDTLTTNIDTFNISLDSRLLTGDNFILSGFSNAHRQINFTGDAMDAVIETQEFQVFPGGRADIRLLRPGVDGADNVTLQMGTRELPTDSVTYDTESSPNTNGECEVRSNSRYHRVRMNITGGFNDAQFIEILEAVKAGKR